MAAAMNHAFQHLEKPHPPPPPPRQNTLLDNILAAMDQCRLLGKHPRQNTLPDSSAVLADSFPSQASEESWCSRGAVKRFRRSPGRIHGAQMHSGALLKGDVCTHPTTFNSLCLQCGQKVAKGRSGLPFTYLCKGLELSDERFGRMRDKELKILFGDKKLYLVLDLDHTLLNSSPLTELTEEENRYLNVESESLKSSLHKLDHIKMMTKLRPYVHSFLKEASKLFELYIYTMGERDYALEMAKLLDPKGIYFNAVLSRGDSTNKDQKALDHFLGLESFVLILDDTQAVWSKHTENLLVMDRYNFFASSCHRFGLRCKSLSEQRRDENETNGALASVLNVLQQVHTSFYHPEHEEYLINQDVRQLLKTAKKEVLKGCKIIFSRIFPSDFRAEKHRLWKLAKEMGAICSTELDPTVTHVVSLDAGTQKSRWAVQEKKFLVHPTWIDAASYLWRKMPEDDYPVRQQPTHL